MFDEMGWLTVVLHKLLYCSTQLTQPLNDSMRDCASQLFTNLKNENN